MLQSILVYSFLIGVMLLFSLFTARKGNLYPAVPSGMKIQQNFWSLEIITPLVLFAVVFGMRYDVGVDHINYLEGYLNKEYVSKGELLFDLLSQIGWGLNLHYTVYFTIIAFVQVYFFFYAFKDQRYLFPFLVFFLFTNGEWLSWMNIIRQSMAMCIWVYYVKYIEERKLWKYVFGCAIALLFHNSAIVLIVFYPILRSGKDYFKNIPFQLFLLAIAFVIQKMFSGFLMQFESFIKFYADTVSSGAYSGYDIEVLQESFIKADGTGFVYLFRIALNVLIIFYSKKLKLFYGDKRFVIVYFFFIVGVIIQNIFPVGLISITRPFRYLYIFQTVMYAHFGYYLYKTRLRNLSYGKIHALMYYGLIIIFLGVFYLSLISGNDGVSLWYQFFFDQNFNGYPDLK